MRAAHKPCSRCLSGIFDKEFDDIPHIYHDIRRIDAEADSGPPDYAEKRWPHFNTIEDLKASSQTCVLCSKLWDEVCKMTAEETSMPEKFFISIHGDLSVWKRRFGWNNSATGQIPFFVRDITSNVSERSNEEDLDIRSDDKLTSHGLIHFEERLPAIQTWLDECDGNHDKCREDRKQNWVPTRLIELTLDEESSPRLIETQHMDPSSFTYTTLSYRWGDVDSRLILTLIENVDEFKKSIPIGRLPKTFIDAMKITRALGLRHIWIDSLCIVQDSESDWQYQAALMCNIFQCSFLNIVATDSKNPNGGCFLDVCNMSLNLCVSENLGDKVNVCLWSADHSLALRSGLAFRGWIFQELILPSRVLHCCENQFIWQCRMQTMSEDGALYSENTFVDFYSSSNGLHIYTNLGLPCTTYYGSPPSGPLQNALRIWRLLIECYCGLDFTFEKDRIAAMAGIVRWFQNRHNLTPALGCWQQLLAWDLGWQIDIYAAPRDKQSYHFRNMPSWSWLSQAGRTISFVGNENCLDCISIIDFNLNWAGEELTSELVSSQLTIRGMLFQVDFQINDVKDLKEGSIRHCDLSISEPSTSNISGRCVFDDGSQLQDAQYSYACLLTGIVSQENGIGGDFLVLSAVLSGNPKQTQQYRREGFGTWRIGFDGVEFGDDPIQALARLYHCQTRLDDKDESTLDALRRIFRKDAVEIQMV